MEMVFLHASYCIGLAGKALSSESYRSVKLSQPLFSQCNSSIMKAFIIALVLTQNENDVLLYTAVTSIAALRNIRDQWEGESSKKDTKLISMADVVYCIL